MDSEFCVEGERQLLKSTRSIQAGFPGVAGDMYYFEVSVAGSYSLVRRRRAWVGA